MKPVKRYKVLQLFHLRCPYCYSGEVGHNAELTRAIAKHEPRDELARICKERAVEIEYLIKPNTKYFPLFINAKPAKADKELLLSDKITEPLNNLI
ncbi:MAG TPA: hypothetical protein VFW07_14065 [Parafilimonas sp.]|nr:hypothetical protein [Parafilimonas sp.]